jgi:hypothetical protein
LRLGSLKVVSYFFNSGSYFHPEFFLWTDIDTYSITLPDNLPPTYKGRAFKFSYEFVVGTCRAASSVVPPSSTLGPSGANSISRVMKVPIRLYNHVSGEYYSFFFAV